MRKNTCCGQYRVDSERQVQHSHGTNVEPRTKLKLSLPAECWGWTDLLYASYTTLPTCWQRDKGMVCGHGCTTLFKKKVFIRNQYVVSKRQSVCVLYKWYICVFFICASLRNCDLLYCMQFVSPPRTRLSAVILIGF